MPTATAFTPRHADAWGKLVQDFLDACDLRGCKPKTIRSYQCQLDLFLVWVRAEGISLDAFREGHYSAFLRHRKRSAKQGKGATNTTLCYDATILKMLFKYGRALRRIKADPLRRATLPRPDNPPIYCPTPEDLDKLLTAIERRWDKSNPNVGKIPARLRRCYQKRDRALICGLIATGCRIGEILSLKLGNYLPDQNRILVERPKTGVDSYVPVSSSWKPILEEWLSVRPKGTKDFPVADTIFLTETGDVMTYEGARSLFRRYRDFAGLPKALHLHCLRHFAGSMLYDTSPAIAQYVLGHVSQRTTSRYAHKNWNTIVEIVNRVDTLGAVISSKQATEKQRRRAFGT